MPQDYHVPRQVTTRLEFLPGFSWFEMGALAIGTAAGLLLFKVGSWLHLSGVVTFVGFFLPPALAFLAFTGGEQNLWRLFGRLRWFQSRPQRMLYRTGGDKSRGAVVPDAKSAAPRGGRKAALRRGGFWPGNKQSQRPQAQNGTVQGWLPVTDVLGGVAVRRDDMLVAAIEVQPFNMGLKSVSEQQRVIARLHEVINSLQRPAQVLSLSRPVDLDQYVRRLQARLELVDQTRRDLLQPYIHYVKTLVGEGDAQERRFYILLPQHVDRGSGGDLLHLAHDVVSRLRQADLTAHVLDELQIINLLYNWCQPAHAAIERAPSGPPSVTVLTEVSRS